MCGKYIIRLVFCVVFSGLVMGQQPQGSVLGQQPGATNLQPRPLQSQRLQPRPSAQNLIRPGVTASRYTPEQAQGPQIPIVEDIRDGPFHDGSYYFGYVSGDGSVREEGAVTTADGAFIVTGSYSYTAPNGELIEMQYISDVNGYRAFPKGSRPDFTAPQRILNAPPLPNTPFVDEVRPFNNLNNQLNRPSFRPQPQQTLGAASGVINQRPQTSFRPVNNNLNNQVNRPFNNLNNQLNRPSFRPQPQQTLGAASGVINTQATSASTLSALSAGVPDSVGSFSTKYNIIAEPIQANDL